MQAHISSKFTEKQFVHNFKICLHRIVIFRPPIPLPCSGQVWLFSCKLGHCERSIKKKKASRQIYQFRESDENDPLVHVNMHYCARTHPGSHVVALLGKS